MKQIDMPDATVPDKPNTGLTTGVRAVLAIVVSVSLGLFIFSWDSNIIPYQALRLGHWIGTLAILPILAICLSMLTNCLIQQLSCSKVQWFIQLQRSSFIAIPVYGMWFLLYLLPILRWPIEGLAQGSSQSFRTGLSSGFYVFWTAMYSQGILGSLAQICPSV